MKHIILSFFLLLSIQGIACTCSTIPLLQRVSSSDFIATVKILKVVPDKENSEYHNLEIEIIDLYKGQQTKSLRLHSFLISSCAFYTPQNTRWLIFASKNKDGKLGFGACSGAEQIGREIDSLKYPRAKRNIENLLRLKLQVLEYLKVEKINPGNEFRLEVDENEFFEKMKGYKVSNERFALYELWVKPELTVSRFKALKSFDNKNLNALIDHYIKNDLSFYANRQAKNIQNETRVVVAFYYYPQQDGNPSFISTYDL